MQAAKEKASNAAAAARAGTEKTKATVQEKLDKMKAQDQAEKAKAEQSKEDKKQVAETDKQITKADNAEGRAVAQSGEHRFTTGPGSGATVDRTPVAGERTIDRDTVIGTGTGTGHRTGTDRIN